MQILAVQQWRLFEAWSMGLAGCQWLVACTPAASKASADKARPGVRLERLGSPKPLEPLRGPTRQTRFLLSLLSERSRGIVRAAAQHGAGARGLAKIGLGGEEGQPQALTGIRIRPQGPSRWAAHGST